MLTSSFGCTPSPASVAITSLAFVFDEVPEPVWKTSIGNWSSSSPFAIRSAAAAIRSAFSGSSNPSSAFTRAAAALIRPSHRATSWGIGSPETGKFSIALRVSPPQSSSSHGLDSSARAFSSSSSQLVSLTRGRPCGSPRPRSCRSIASQPAYSTNSMPRSRRSDFEVALAGREHVGRGILEQPVARLRRILLVRADHAARAALDPAGDVDARLCRSRALRRSESRRGPRRRARRVDATPR